MPHRFYGTLKLYRLADKSDASDAPVGSSLEVRIGGAVWESFTTVQAGQYTVTVRGRTSNETAIELWVNVIKADQTATFSIG